MLVLMYQKQMKRAKKVRLDHIFKFNNKNLDNISLGFLFKCSVISTQNQPKKFFPRKVINMLESLLVDLSDVTERKQSKEGIKRAAFSECDLNTALDTNSFMMTLSSVVFRTTSKLRFCQSGPAFDVGIVYQAVTYNALPETTHSTV